MGSPTTDSQILMFKISELQPDVCHNFHKFPNWQQTFKKLLYLSHGKKNYFTEYYISYKYYVMIIFRKLLPFLIAYRHFNN